MSDFFISYTSADSAWAEWVAYVLEEEGYTVVIQVWDFRPGSNFVLEMQRAASSAQRTIMILSPDYLASRFTSSEWASAFAQDPQGVERALVPILVRGCQLDGILRTIVHINIVDLPEDSARNKIIRGVQGGRAKPMARPAFPGVVNRAAAKVFPGNLGVGRERPIREAYMPKVHRQVSDVEKRQYVKNSFETIGSSFETWLARLQQQHPDVQTDYERISATELSAEVFIHGKSVCRCRIWRGTGYSQDAILYAEGSTVLTSGASNETLCLDASGGTLFLSAQMAIVYGAVARRFDTRHLTPEDAAEYLWCRFVERMERT